MQRGVQVTQAFRNEIGKSVKTKRLTTGRTQKAFALDVGTTATTLRNIEMRFVFGITAFAEKGCRGYRFTFQPVKEVAASIQKATCLIFASLIHSTNPVWGGIATRR